MQEIKVVNQFSRHVGHLDGQRTVSNAPESEIANKDRNGRSVENQNRKTGAQINLSNMPTARRRHGTSPNRTKKFAQNAAPENPL